MKTAQQREQRLREAAAAYYNSGESLMTDAEYDTLKAEHAEARRADPENPIWNDTVLDQVGAEPPATFEKVKRDTPMLSLSNVFATDTGCEGLVAWQNGLPAGTHVVMEPKIDGVSLELYYRQGRLTLALTRGDGTVGSDVTANMRGLSSIPTRLRNVFVPMDDSEAEQFNFDDLVVRGELAISHSDFAVINADNQFANPRNAASGAVMSKDPQDATTRKLQFVLHSFVSGTGAWAQLVGQGEFLLRASNAGFRTVRSYGWRASDEYKQAADGVVSAYQFPVDGMVAKVDRFDVRRTLGATGTAPRWAVAVKFPQEQRQTKLTGITIQVGRSGVLTPVAELEPVRIDGSVVSRASLHNETFVNDLGLCVGDTVLVQKAAAIIPEVVRSVTHSENPDRTRHSFSVVNHVGGVCPACGSRELESETTSNCTKWFCRNQACVSALSARIAYWASRQCFDVEGIGGEAAEALAKLYLREAHNPNGLEAAFFPLECDTDDLAGLTWTTESGGKMTFGAARAAKAMEALRKAKDKPLRVWIAGAGIPSVGINTSKELSRLFCSADDLCDDAQDETGLLHSIANGSDKAVIRNAFNVDVSHHLGPVSAREVIGFVKEHGNAWRCFMPLQHNGSLTVFSDNFHGDAQTAVGPLSGKSVCVTGTLSVGRTEFHRRLEAAGAKIASGVSAKTDILVAGEAAGSKLAKAEKLKIRIMTEQEITGML